MNDRLKFRVWNPLGNPGWLDMIGDWGYYYISIDGKFIVHYNKIGLGDHPLGRAKQVNLSYMIVQQFTGCFDKTGKEIYEGDIVKTSLSHMFRSNIYAVKYLQNRFVPDDICDTDDVEIIGNIFENPELIKNEN